MIKAISRGTRLSLLVTEVTKKHFQKSLFYQSNNSRSSSSKGYVVTIGNKISKIRKKDHDNKLLRHNIIYEFRRNLSTDQDLQSINFEKISNETLESLAEYFDQILEVAVHLTDSDVSCGDGVLTIKFGHQHGTYVINRQVPNQQIWLSSPKSGPKRYDFIDGTWIYKHDGKSLHDLLDEEIPDIVEFPVSFQICSFSTKNK